MTVIATAGGWSIQPFLPGLLVKARNKSPWGSQPMGFYLVNSLIQDGKRRGIRFLPASVVHSDDRTSVVSDKVVRLGLLHVKGLGRDTAARIRDERLRCPFASLEDFIDRCQPNQRERRLLAKAGAPNYPPSAIAGQGCGRSNCHSIMTCCLPRAGAMFFQR